jgi:hypothetical protein
VSQPYPQQGAPASAIGLTAKFLPLAFFFYFVKPAIEIDGYKVQGAWGRNVVPVQPGRHQVHVHTPYFLPSRVGPADVIVDVLPGQTLELEYRSPLVVFLKGALGAPPQKYPGMVAMIILYAVLALLVLCACLVPLLASTNS